MWDIYSINTALLVFLFYCLFLSALKILFSSQREIELSFFFFLKGKRHFLRESEGLKKALAGPSCRGFKHNTVTDTLTHWMIGASLSASVWTPPESRPPGTSSLSSARGRLPRKTSSLQKKAELLPPWRYGKAERRRQNQAPGRWGSSSVTQPSLDPQPAPAVMQHTVNASH